MEELNYILIDDASEVAAACERLSRHAELGFDTETTSLSPFDGRLRLVQLAAPGEPVYVFDLFKLAPSGDTVNEPALEPLRRLLAATRPVKVAHNCLAGDMLVSMSDGTKIRIDKMVRERAGGEVLCVDEETGAISTGTIVDWVDGGIRAWDDWLRIRMRGKGRLRVTKDHEVLTERGRVRAENLLVGDKVLTSLPALSQPQRDMLYGSLLGDGSLTMQRSAQARTPHFKVSHSSKQEGYVTLKAAALADLVKLVKTENVNYRGFSDNANGTQLIALTTKSDPRLFELYDNCLTEGRRTLTRRWLDNLSAPAIAVWYCDDGSLSKTSVRICVSALGRQGADTLVEFLRSREFPARLWVRPDGQLYVKVSGPYGRGMSAEMRHFWESIAPYVPTSMRHKLPEAYAHLASDEYWTTGQPRPGAFSDTVVEISPLLNDSVERRRYDGYRRGKRRGIKQYCLTVSTHRNFVAGGLAVSNCKFDAKWVRHHLGVELCGEFDSRAESKKEVERGGLFDTLLASQLISAGEQEDRHSLASVAERYLNQAVDKTQQVSDWGGELSAAQLEYAARDAALMLPLRLKLVDALRAAALTRTAQLEFECVVPLAALELAGVYLDQPCWRAKLKDIGRQREELHELLQDELSEEPAQQSLFGPVRADINLDSHVQLTRALKRVLPAGEEIPDSTRNWKLEPLALKFPVVRRILDYRTLQKTLKFGETLLQAVNPTTGRIHSNFHQIGAPTGRMSCTDPNVQQVPHAFDMRRCFRAPEGRKLIDADYSQIELRILADFTGDRGFVDAFTAGVDLHRATAAQVFNVKNIEDVTKEQRDFAKRLNFGVVYGIGARRFALLTGLKESEAEDLLRRYFATYRDLDSWLREAGNKAVRERTAPRTVAGRLFRFNFDPEDRQAASLAHRGGKNSPIQGCVRKGTRILTREHGYVPIEEVAHEELTVWDGRDYVNAAVVPSGPKRLVRLELWGGHYIECSPDHKFWTIDANGSGRWLSAEGLSARKQIYVDITGPVPGWELPLDLRVFEPRDLTLRHQPTAKPHNAKTLSLEAFQDRFSLGLWTGRLASDGSVSSLATKRPGNVVLMVAEHEEAILPELEALTGTFGYFGKRTRVTPTQPGAFHSLTVGSISLTRQLLHYGIKERVPDFLWKSKSALRGYLLGMFDGDGTVNVDGPVLTFGKGPSHHVGWARQIQEALLLFGVRSRINRCADRINVRVLKRDSHRFAEQIGFMNPAKQSKLAAVTPQAYVDDSEIYGRAVRVRSVEITGEMVEMYDVVNSASEKFMANGIITHNSSADIIKRAMRLLHDRLKGTGAAIVNVVHDEIVVETAAGEAEEMSKVVEGAMCDAGEEYVKAVPVKVEASVTDEWVK